MAAACLQPAGRRMSSKTSKRLANGGKRVHELKGIYLSAVDDIQSSLYGLGVQPGNVWVRLFWLPYREAHKARKACIFRVLLLVCRLASG